MLDIYVRHRLTPEEYPHCEMAVWNFQNVSLSNISSWSIHSKLSSDSCQMNEHNSVTHSYEPKFQTG